MSKDAAFAVQRPPLKHEGQKKGLRPKPETLNPKPVPRHETADPIQGIILPVPSARLGPVRPPRPRPVPPV